MRKTTNYYAVFKGVATFIALSGTFTISELAAKHDVQPKLIAQ